MIRTSARIASTRLATIAGLVALSLPVCQAFGQTQVPPAPAQAQPVVAPSAPAPAGPPVFPKPDPANFTAVSPTKDVVNAFLQASWGYDENRMWQVQAIFKTPVDGVSKVVIFIGDKTGKEKATALSFFALADGKHIISGDQLISFGEHPFAAYRAILQTSADGPYRGAPAKDMEIVEFTDFQCPHCKEAQANMDKLATDFPKARIVFQNNPLTSIHPYAATAAAYGVCVNKLGGSTPFFQFAAAVFEGQSGLSTADGATLTLNSAVTKAGLDPAKVSACAITPEVKAQVDASVKLGADMGITAVHMLMINGRQVPANAPSVTIKKIVIYQAGLDGVTL